MNKGDLLLYISFLLIIGSIIIFAYYSYVDKVNECTSDPIRYAVEEIRENYNATFVNGNMYILTQDGSKSWNFGDGFDINNINNISLE